MSKRIVLGIDPGSIKTGFGLIYEEGSSLQYVASGNICPPKKESLSQRLHYISIEVEKIIQKYSPEFFAMESMFYSKNVKSLIALSHIRGALLLCALKKDLIICEYSPLEVKQSTVGYGRASKEQVASMVGHLFPSLTSISSFDETDALAVAVCHTAHYRTQQKYLGASA